MNVAAPELTLANTGEEESTKNAVGVLEEELEFCEETVSVSEPTLIVVSEGEYDPFMQNILLSDAPSRCILSHAFASVVQAVLEAFKHQ